MDGRRLFRSRERREVRGRGGSWKEVLGLDRGRAFGEGERTAREVLHGQAKRGVGRVEGKLWSCGIWTGGVDGPDVGRWGSWEGGDHGGRDERREREMKDASLDSPLLDPF